MPDSDMSKLAVPVINEVLSSAENSETPSSINSGEATITPVTSAGASSGTPGESGPASPTCEVTAELLKELDRRLQGLVPAEERIPPRAQPEVDPDAEASRPRNQDLPKFQCAFGFSGAVDKPADIPRRKDAFAIALRAELEAISGIQRGLQSYQAAINSEKYHTFRTEFLVDQNTAIVITIDQLEQIAAHLRKLKKNAEAIDEDKGEIKEELVNAFRQVQPWVMRSRAILRHCHVFYKINFVLASGKQH
jgi:hypothetical protein